ncbi:hypothetical protein J3D55_003790 [Chryseobacterium ginsenosidimutans]|uniref:DUF6443 domain-containing protein n=1 Tax=Chryseobacterium ginsenosidimutans TaxID=687846 RepID=UPI00216A487A|nr:DUF6443 domain-containing protein [Chryseobacterium ginsenosidimutans]MCS3870874.1 hypothetical protein [Chryseobacterium ginsenosidimutans]
MKKIILPVGTLLISGLTLAQTTAENYIQSRTYLEPVTITSSTAKQIQSVQYFDELGRPKQVVNVKASPLGRDVATYIEYDNFGRQLKDYLPVPQQVTQNGNIYTSPLDNATNPNLYGTEKIYSEKILENSPQDKILQQIQVGSSWSTKPVNFVYEANLAEDNVKKYEIVSTWDPVNKMFTYFIQINQNFTLGQLYKNIIIDEDGNKTIEFKNNEGQSILLRKVLSSTENADTYYVYDEYGQLAYVIPPLASVTNAVDETTLNNLCYQYKYDNKGRLVEKKLPGKGKEYMVYDKANRLILMQDANLNVQNQWLVTKYDRLGRITYTGVLTGGSRIGRQAEIENLIVTEDRSSAGFTRSGITVYYTDGAFVNEIPTILSVNYYDIYPQYSFNPAFPSTIQTAEILTDNPDANGLSTKGLPVMSLVKNIEDDNWTKDYIYYDKKGRAIGSYSINHLGGRTKIDSKLDFTGQVQQTITTHKRLDTDIDRVIMENFMYDGQNRLLTHTHQVDNNDVEYLTQNTYNELSQVINKKVGGITPSIPLQDITYSYNIRGWMTKINDPANLNGKLFGYEMRYNNPVSSNIVPGRFNGNIAEVDWVNSQDGILKRYNYEYDNLDRLKNAFYKEPTTGNSSYFDEKLTYDLNGNIMTLKRFAPQVFSMTATMVDDLEYKYTGNRLDKVIENVPNSTGYEGGNNVINYDLNGSMTNMKDKGIELITYNHLSLPNAFAINQVDPLSGTNVNFSLYYLYGADGTKLRKTYTTGGGRGQSTTNKYTDYLDGFQYSFSETVQPCLWCRNQRSL